MSCKIANEHFLFSRSSCITQLILIAQLILKTQFITHTHNLIHCNDSTHNSTRYSYIHKLLLNRLHDGFGTSKY